MVTVMKDEFQYTRIEAAIRYLSEHRKEQPSLEEVAEKVHLSPFHFQRLFTDWAGISPKRFLQFLTVDYLKSRLSESGNLTHAADEAGLSGQSRVYDLFTTLEAMTPQEYRQHGEGIDVQFGFHETPFGQCLLGITRRGVCWMTFISSGEDAAMHLDEMKSHWNRSVFHQNQEATSICIRRIFEGGTDHNKLHLLVKGTNFQVKVWEALLRLPMGQVTTYQQIATRIGQPKALQAVGSAVGANHIAFLIPCHRVIRKDGILGEYRWNPARKKSIIGWEMAKAS